MAQNKNKGGEGNKNSEGQQKSTHGNEGGRESTSGNEGAEEKNM